MKVPSIASLSCLALLLATPASLRADDPEPPRFLLHGRRLHLHAAPGRFWRTGVDGHDLMAVGHEFEQRRHREVGRTHEDQAERHEAGIRYDLFTPSWPGLSRHDG